MRPSRRDILIATRRSQLALAQSQMAGNWIHKLNPKVGLRLIELESEGDRVMDRPLAALGGKGLFTRAVEQAVLDGRADIAVHSLKDLPTEPTPGLTIVATPRRAPVHDVLISASAKRIEDLPRGATIGTCSPRRKSQLLRLRPDLNIVLLRGNVDTRLRKVLEEELMDATLLAAAGLARLNLPQHLVAPVPVEQVLPAAGQGALAIQCRVDDHITMRRCLPLHDTLTGTTANAERDVVAKIGANCHSPVAVLAESIGVDKVRLRARVLSHDGQDCLEVDMTEGVKKLRALCNAAAKQLLDQGARKLIEEAAAAPSASAPETAVKEKELIK